MAVRLCGTQPLDFIYVTMQLLVVPAGCADEQQMPPTLP